MSAPKFLVALLLGAVSGVALGFGIHEFGKDLRPGLFYWIDGWPTEAATWAIAGAFVAGAVTWLKSSAKA